MPTVFCLPEAIIQKQCQEGIIVSIEATVITEHKSDIDSMYNKHKELWTIITHSKLYVLKIMSGQIQLYDDGYDSASLAAVGSYGDFTIAFIKHILWTGGATLNICANYLCMYGIACIRLDRPRRRSSFYIIVTLITLFPTVVMIKKFGYITHKPRVVTCVTGGCHNDNLRTINANNFNIYRVPAHRGSFLPVHPGNHYEFTGRIYELPVVVIARFSSSIGNDLLADVCIVVFPAMI